MKTRIFYLTAAIAALLPGCRPASDGVVVFDAGANYPVLDLKLSDVADVAYIRLNHGSEEVLLRRLNNAGRQLYITDDRIYLVDDDTRLLVYDRLGNMLFKVDRLGRGPGEYYPGLNLVVDPVRREILLFTSSLKKVIVLDMDGNYVEEVVGPVGDYFSSRGMLGDRILGYYEGHANYPMAVVDPREGITDSVRIDYRLPKIIDPDGLAAYSQLVDAPGGKFVFTFRSDTLYFIDNDLKVRPRFVNRSYDLRSTKLYPPHLYPTVETDKYVFFTSICSPVLFPDEKNRFYAYDKNQGRFFRLRQLSDGKNTFRHGYGTYYEALVRDSPEILNEMITLNHNYAGILLAADFLIEHREMLPEPLRQIASTLRDEYDNPVLMLIKFR